VRDEIKIGLPKTKIFGLGLVVSTLQGLSAVALLAASAWLISRAAEQPPVMYLMIAVVGVRGFALGRAGFRYGERLLLHESAFRKLSEIRPRIFEKLINFMPAGLGAQKRGDTITRVGADVDELQNLPLRVISPIIQSALVSVFAVIGLGLLLPSAALALLLFLLAAFFFAMPLSGLISKASDLERATVNAKFAAQSIELLEHLEVLIAYGWLSGKLKDLSKTDEVLNRISKRKSFGNGVGQAIFSLLATGATLVSALIGARSVESFDQPGVMLALIALVPLAVFDVVSNAQPAVSAFRTYRSSAKRILQMQARQLPTALLPGFGNQEISGFKNLNLRQVAIAYPESTPVFQGFDFDLNAGETIAIQGQSGSGKTTIALALLRFLDLNSGSYQINGSDAKEYSESSIRKSIGLVEQDPTIFLGTVRANLLIAHPEASDVELWNILDRVGLKRLFANRQGLETELGERGVLISGGEAQRLALARALLADFQVLVLDEPTANVDQDSARNLLEDLLAAAKFNSNRAIVLITHDADLAKLADKIQVV
jgi:ATP-binding cassette subfamily C protein CydC